jgi:hypothetical protein
VRPNEEDITDRGVDLEPLFAAARREMRGRGGVQISGGYGISATARGDAVNGDSLDSTRHLLWLAGQITLGARFDLLTTAQWRGAPGMGPSLWAGGALLRKMNPADVQLELYYDSRAERVHPGLTAEIRALPRLDVLASFSSQNRLDDPPSVTRISARAGVRWFVAYDR